MKRMTLALLSTSAPYAWRLGDRSSHDRLKLADYVSLIQTAERGMIDIFFLADELRHPRGPHGPGADAWFQQRGDTGCVHSAVDPGGGDQPYRPRRHRLNDLQRAL